MHFHMRMGGWLRCWSTAHMDKSELMLEELQISHGIQPMVKLPDGKVISYDLQNVDEDYEDIYLNDTAEGGRLH